MKHRNALHCNPTFDHTLLYSSWQHIGVPLYITHECAPLHHTWVCQSTPHMSVPLKTTHECAHPWVRPLHHTWVCPSMSAPSTPHMNVPIYTTHECAPQDHIWVCPCTPQHECAHLPLKTTHECAPPAGHNSAHPDRYWLLHKGALSSVRFLSSKCTLH